MTNHYFILLASASTTLLMMAEAFSSILASSSEMSQLWLSHRRYSATAAAAKVPTQHRPSAVALVALGSLRDLVERSSGNFNNDNDRNADDTKEEKPNNNNNNNVDDFNNLLDFSRSKFADTKKLLNSRGDCSRSGYYYHDADERRDDEKGLYSDRLSAFSFATNAPRSQSQGGGGTSTAVHEIDDDDDDLENNALPEETALDSKGDMRIDETKFQEKTTSTSGVGTRKNTILMTDDYAADNFNSMVGTFYSKQKFPSREKGKISDTMDERGLHGDRLSTFSFSSSSANNAFSFATLRSPKSQSERFSSNIVVEEGGMINEDVLKVNENENDIGDDTALYRAVIDEEDDGVNNAMLVDDFNSMVGTFYSKQKFPSREKRKFVDDTDEKGLHGDRLSTFSFSSVQPKLKTTTPSPTDEDDDVGAVPDDDDEILPGSSDERSFASTLDRLPPTASPIKRTSTAMNEADSPSLFNTVNHNDRLGTFSFASTDPHSGSTSSKGTSASSPLVSASDSKITPPQSRPKDSNPVLDKSAHKGSLSSIASSVSIKSRNDRIKDIKDATDPKLLHPDDMNIPRLNSKGDVMTLSSTGGRLNIFQRIDNVKRVTDGSDEDDDVTNAAISDNGEGHGDCFIGFDLGTSGARMSIAEKRFASNNGGANQWKYVELVTEALAWNDKLQYDNAGDWRVAINILLSRVRGDAVMTRIKAICVSGTSASCLLLNRYSLDVARSARMYNYDILSSSPDSAVAAAEDDSPAKRVMKLIDTYVPEKHTARATTGSLAKLLLWNEVKPLVNNRGEIDEVFCHQSDYINMSLMWGGLDTYDDKSCRVVSDWHNCLKLGYDVQRLEFPSWMYELLKDGANILDPESVLPSKVVSPGELIGVISPVVASTYGLPSDVVIVGGTTDSNAAFFASAGTKPDFGTSVTSLGSTMAIKMLSQTFVEDASRGVYSHRFPIFGNNRVGERNKDAAWLIGGASNVGCAILRQEGFSNEELRTLSDEIDPNSDCSHKYYPLTKQGERFPVADSTKQPVLTPKPDSRRDYLHGILQGIGDVEREGYRVLGELGANPKRPSIVLTAGGGSANDVWMSMRERLLRESDDGQRVAVRRASNTEASYGAALLAAASFERIDVPSSSGNYGTQENFIN